MPFSHKGIYHPGYIVTLESERCGFTVVKSPVLQKEILYVRSAVVNKIRERKM